MNNNSKFSINNLTINTNNSKIIGNNNTIKGNNNKIVGNNNKVTGNNNKSIGYYNSFIGNNNKVSGPVINLDDEIRKSMNQLSDNQELDRLREKVMNAAHNKDKKSKYPKPPPPPPSRIIREPGLFDYFKREKNNDSGYFIQPIPSELVKDQPKYYMVGCIKLNEKEYEELKEYLENLFLVIGNPWEEQL